MLRIGEIKTLYNKENKHYYEVQVFLSSLSDLKWANNFATGCRSTNKKQNPSSTQNNKDIEILYYFKHKKYLEKFIGKLKKYINY